MHSFRALHLPGRESLATPKLISQPYSRDGGNELKNLNLQETSFLGFSGCGPPSPMESGPDAQANNKRMSVPCQAFLNPASCQWRRHSCLRLSQPLSSSFQPQEKAPTPRKGSGLGPQCLVSGAGTLACASFPVSSLQPLASRTYSTVMVVVTLRDCAAPGVESVTCTVRLHAPVFTGVPLILPVTAFRLRPSHAVPEVSTTDQV